MSKRVLVCEDDPGIRLLLQQILYRLGLAVDTVATGSETLALIQDHCYDLILLDLLTPGLSGYEVLEILRHEQPDLLDRVVILTALQRALREDLPVAAIMAKPFDLPQFDQIIQRVIDRSGTEAPA
jgi:CheY-like chemotaxis protein